MSRLRVFLEMLTQRNTPRVRLKILYVRNTFCPSFPLTSKRRPKTPLTDYVVFFITSVFSSCSVKRMCWTEHYSPPADAFFHIPLALFLLVHFQCALSISHLRTLPSISPFLLSNFFRHPHFPSFAMCSAFSFPSLPLSFPPFFNYLPFLPIPPCLHSYSPIPSLLSSRTCLLFRSGLWRFLALGCAQETFTDIRNILISSGQVGTIFVSSRHHLLSAP